MSRLLLLLLLLLPATAGAQYRKSAFYLEGGGSAGFGSLNLELGLGRQLRIRGGAGLMYVWPTVPVTASVLLGHGANSIEIGGGATFIFTPPDIPSDSPTNDFLEHIFFASGEGTMVMATGILGYRYQPAEGAMIRATATPLVFDGHVQFWFGLSLGYSF